jgi:hypothetical protein
MHIKFSLFLFVTIQINKVILFYALFKKEHCGIFSRSVSEPAVASTSSAGGNYNFVGRYFESSLQDEVKIEWTEPVVEVVDTEDLVRVKDEVKIEWAEPTVEVADTLDFIKVERSEADQSALGAVKQELEANERINVKIERTQGRGLILYFVLNISVAHSVSDL